MQRAIGFPALSSAEQPTQYWKIPEFYELYIQFGLADEGAFRGLIDMQPNGWTHGGGECDWSSVWNRSEGLSFVNPRVAWAEIQFRSHAP